MLKGKRKGRNSGGILTLIVLIICGAMIIIVKGEMIPLAGGNLPETVVSLDSPTITPTADDTISVWGILALDGVTPCPPAPMTCEYPTPVEDTRFVLKWVNGNENNTLSLINNQDAQSLFDLSNAYRWVEVKGRFSSASQTQFQAVSVKPASIGEMPLKEIRTADRDYSLFFTGQMFEPGTYNLNPIPDIYEASGSNGKYLTFMSKDCEGAEQHSGNSSTTLFGTFETLVYPPETVHPPVGVIFHCTGFVLEGTIPSPSLTPTPTPLNRLAH